MLTWRALFIILVICWSIVHGCQNDSHCKTHQVCCGNKCKTWPRCFLNTDKDCFQHKHCKKGETCVNNACIRKSAPIKCTTQEDCRSTDTSLDCCHGKCLPSMNCTKPLQNNSRSTITNLNLPVLVYSCKNICPTGSVCINRTCTRLITSTHTTTRQVKEHTRDKLTTGLLSAALFSGAVLLSFVCFCFLKETKYYKKFCYEGHERTRESLPTHCSRHQQSILNDSRRLIGATATTHGITIYPDHPPPSYDEVVNNYGNSKC